MKYQLPSTEEVLKMIEDEETYKLPRMTRKVTAKDIQVFEQFSECFNAIHEINEKARQRIEARRNNR
jgi:hypothetical protein